MFKRLIFICLVLFSAWFVLAQDEPIFELQGDGQTPAIAHVEDGDYEEQFTDSGAVIYYEGQFHMFRNGFKGWPASVWIHHMVSDDGINWEQLSSEPVLLTEDVPFAKIAALASSVIVEDDGTWVLYFYAWNGGGSLSNGTIGRATATNPEGEWVVDSEPILVPGDGDAWDKYGVGAPQVIKTDSGYIMYYEGINIRGDRLVGMASSDDGIDWTKYENNPILTPELSWEGSRLHQPRVIQVDDTFVMVYRTQSGTSNTSMRLGIAISSDGIEWKRFSDEPILSVDVLEYHRAFYYTALTSDEDTAYLYVELYPEDSFTTDIFVFTASLDALREE